MYKELLVKGKGLETLGAFVKKASMLIGFYHWQKRESSNYFGGEYFLGNYLGFEIIVSHADDSEFTEYSFQMSFEFQQTQCAAEESFKDFVESVARKLVLGKYEIIQPLDISREGSGAISYKLNDQGNQIVVINI